MFRNPVHPAGGCVFGGGIIQIEAPSRRDDSVSGATRRRPQPRQWIDYAVEEDDMELVELVSILLMAEVL